MENRTVRIGLIQTSVSEDTTLNLNHTRDLVIRAAEQGASLICLQELFRTPYFPRHEHADASAYAETIPGETTDLFSGLARDLGVHLVVPIYERSGSGSFHNTAVMIDQRGTVLPPYRKIHIPFDPFFYEKNYFRPGHEYRVYTTPVGKVGVLICYDQWFPCSRSWGRNLSSIPPPLAGYGEWKSPKRETGIMPGRRCREGMPSRTGCMSRR
jgi:agmatine deiminase